MNRRTYILKIPIADQVIPPNLALSAYQATAAAGETDAMENPHSAAELRRKSHTCGHARLIASPSYSASLKVRWRGALAVPDGIDIMLGMFEEIIHIIALPLPTGSNIAEWTAFVMFRRIATFTGMFTRVAPRADFSLDVDAALPLCATQPRSFLLPTLITQPATCLRRRSLAY